MSKVQRFEDLEAWKCARELVKQVYRITRQGEFARDFAMKGQIRSAAISVGSNIAEGFERGGDREFLQFLEMRKGPAGKCVLNSTWPTTNPMWMTKIFA